MADASIPLNKESVLPQHHGSPVSKRDSPRFSSSHKSQNKLAVVIPTHNNELVIGSLVLLARQYANHVIFVDDSSQDLTVEVATQAGAHVIPAGYTGGRIYAILTGCKQALGYGCTAVVLLDTQAKHLIREIPPLAKPILDGEVDLVIGSRTLAGRKGIPPFQLGDTGNFCTLPNSGQMFHNSDPSSTFRALSIRAICLLDLLPDSAEFESAMISLFSGKGLILKEIPVKSADKSLSVFEKNIPRYRGYTIAVVVPAHNEQLLIGETLTGIPDFVARVYVVNDCSTDKTQDIIDYYAKHDKSIIPIQHEVNQGVGAAITTGYKKALEDNMDIVAVMAGDNQMDPAFLPQLLDPIIDKKCDYSMGNRLIISKYRERMSKWRFLGNVFLTLLTKISSGYWKMVDPQNGYTAISKRALEQINLDRIYSRYGYCNDMLVKLNVENFRIACIPHPPRYGLETSGIRYGPYIVKVSNLLLKNFLWRMKVKYLENNFHPLVFFYFFGVIFTGLGILGGLYSLYFKFILGHPFFIPGISSLIAFAIGLQTIFFAMFFDMQEEKNSDGWY